MSLGISTTISIPPFRNQKTKIQFIKEMFLICSVEALKNTIESLKALLFISHFPKYDFNDFLAIEKLKIIIIYYSSGEERVRRAECEDALDMFACFYTAVEDDACSTQGHLCAYTCGLC